MFRITPSDLLEEGVVAGEQVAERRFDRVAGEDDVFHCPWRKTDGDNSKEERDVDESSLQAEFSWEEQKNSEKTWKNYGEEIVFCATCYSGKNSEEEKGFSFRCLEELQEIECGEKRVAPKARSIL